MPEDMRDMRRERLPEPTALYLSEQRTVHPGSGPLHGSRLLAGVSSRSHGDVRAMFVALIRAL